MDIDNETNPVLGFDLGTTFSALARWADRKTSNHSKQVWSRYNSVGRLLRPGK